MQEVKIANSFNKMVWPYKARGTFHAVPFYCRFVRTVIQYYSVKTGTFILVPTIHMYYQVAILDGSCCILLKKSWTLFWELVLHGHFLQH